MIVLIFGSKHSFSGRVKASAAYLVQSSVGSRASNAVTTRQDIPGIGLNGVRHRRREVASVHSRRLWLWPREVERV